MHIGVGKKQDGKIQDSQELGTNQLELEENQSKPFSQNVTQAKRCLLIRYPVPNLPSHCWDEGLTPPHTHTLSAGAVPGYPGVKSGTTAEAGGAAQCEPLQG